MQPIHFRNFMGPGTLCGVASADVLITPRPEQATCKACLARMGRAASATKAESDPGKKS
jgi:hypothetical protein